MKSELKTPCRERVFNRFSLRLLHKFAVVSIGVLAAATGGLSVLPELLSGHAVIIEVVQVSVGQQVVVHTSITDCKALERVVRDSSVHKFDREIVVGEIARFDPINHTTRYCWDVCAAVRLARDEEFAVFKLRILREEAVQHVYVD